MVRPLAKYDESRFWKRLVALGTDLGFHGDRTALETLRGNVRQVADHSGYILLLIVRFLPQYTLHDENHILNVLGLMDALTPDEVMGQLTPLECALCILAAYTHDLGMALWDDEYRAITDPEGQTPECQRFLRFRDCYGEDVRRVERLSESDKLTDRERAEHIESHILAEYIRVTHTDADATSSRINDWLEAMKIPDVANNPSLFTYGGIDYQQWLVLIGVSHGHGVGWLRDQLTRPPGGPDGFLTNVGRGEWANLAFPGLLLRLADIMDFDATRTPRILFKHIGIDNAVSLREWNKHLAITGWDLETPPSGEPRLTYSATQCRHPVYEKSIRDFASWIDAEIRSVREELDWQCRLLRERGKRFSIRLPREVTLDIKPAGWPQAPIYVYRDLQFQLDQDEIQQLLMGETLYGDPSLCIRELLQNALDALELRDLRLKMLDKDKKPHEPVDPRRVVDGKPEVLRVTLTWGHDEDSGQGYLLVVDNGVGMTEEVITRYFTQVGKSYYRSPEYHQERAALAACGLISSPISIFGIGILSCFMIADRFQVRTRPGGANGTNRALRDITISGPDSLFWLRPGTLEHQGTEIKLFLKSRFHLQHDAKAFLPGLRKHFYYPEGKGYEPGEGVIDPPFIAAAHVVWPRYPIDVRVPQGKTIRIDDRFHLDTLAPIDPQAVIAKAAVWNCPKEFIGRPEWGVWDWEDTDGPGATGSRIRLWFPHNHATRSHPDLPIDPPAGKGLCRQDELAAFVEPQLEWASGETRSRVLVRGMHVAENEVARIRLEVLASVGTRAWVDLRGAAAPGLTADRRRTIIPEDGGTWSRAVEDFFRRGSAALRSVLDNRERGLWKNIASGFHWRGGPTFHKPTREVRREFELARACETSWNNKHADYLLFKMSNFLQFSATDLSRAAPPSSPAAPTSPLTSSATSPSPTASKTLSIWSASSPAPAPAPSTPTSTAPSPSTPSSAPTASTPPTA